MLINTTTDMQALGNSPEYRAFLTNLLNDYIVFDDAEYPENYDRMLQAGDEGYIEPIVRKEWNSEFAASWGFSSRAKVKTALSEAEASA